MMKGLIFRRTNNLVGLGLCQLETSSIPYCTSNDVTGETRWPAKQTRATAPPRHLATAPPCHRATSSRGSCELSNAQRRATNEEQPASQPGRRRQPSPPSACLFACQPACLSACLLGYNPTTCTHTFTTLFSRKFSYMKIPFHIPIQLKRMPFPINI